MVRITGAKQLILTVPAAQRSSSWMQGSELQGPRMLTVVTELIKCWVKAVVGFHVLCAGSVVVVDTSPNT